MDRHLPAAVAQTKEKAVGARPEPVEEHDVVPLAPDRIEDLPAPADERRREAAWTRIAEPDQPSRDEDADRGAVRILPDPLRDLCALGQKRVHAKTRAPAEPASEVVQEDLTAARPLLGADQEQPDGHAASGVEGLPAALPALTFRFTAVGREH